jgi:hypothetical protein
MNYLAVIALVTASDLALIPTALSADGLQINKTTPAGPVGALTLKRNDAPNYLTGIGHVQAYNTVAVRSQVEGHVLKLREVPIELGPLVRCPSRRLCAIPRDNLLGQIDEGAQARGHVAAAWIIQAISRIRGRPLA